MKKIPLKGGDEHDALTGWRRVLKFAPGARKLAKRKYNRRFRRKEREEVNGQTTDNEV